VINSSNKVRPLFATARRIGQRELLLLRLRDQTTCTANDYAHQLRRAHVAGYIALVNQQLAANSESAIASSTQPSMRRT